MGRRTVLGPNHDRFKWFRGFNIPLRPGGEPARNENNQAAPT